MAPAQPRVQAPGIVARDEVFQVRTLISHPMETGLRMDASGRPIPRDLINTLTCYYNDAVVFRAELNEGVAANPFLSFFVRATDSGTLRFVWQRDGGESYTLQSPLTVVG